MEAKHRPDVVVTAMRYVMPWPMRMRCTRLRLRQSMKTTDSANKKTEFNGPAFASVCHFKLNN